jgi:hypothetical protein
MAAAGRVILTVPPLANRILTDALQGNFILRLLALLIDTSQIIKIELARGYWIIMITLGVLFLVEGVFLFMSKGVRE